MLHHLTLVELTTIVHQLEMLNLVSPALKAKGKRFQLQKSINRPDFFVDESSIQDKEVFSFFNRKQIGNKMNKLLLIKAVFSLNSCLDFQAGHLKIGRSLSSTP